MPPVTPGLIATLLCAAGPAMAQGMPPKEPPPEETVFTYTHPGRTVTLTPSAVYGAALAHDESEKGAAATPPDGLILDPRSSRPELTARGLTLYRIPPNRPPKGLETEERPLPWIQVLHGELPAQPVFEQGAALKIPTDEVLMGLEPGTSLERAKIILREVSSILGIEDLAPVRDGVFLVTLKDAGGGRALAASRTIDKVEGVLYAEPNFIDIFLETPGGPPELPPVADSSPLLSTPRSIDSSPGGRALLPLGRSPSDKDWTLVFDGHFEGIVIDWTVARDAGSVRVLPVITKSRAHDHRRSAYMTGLGLAGKPPPGPYPDGANTFLISPPFALVGYEDAFVEIWFWARFEHPARDPAAVYDYGRVLLFDAILQEFVQSVPLVPLPFTGDLALEPSTQNGWRRLLFRIPRTLFPAQAHLLVQFVSDQANGWEGLYIDDLRVFATLDTDRPKSTEDPLSHRQWALFPHGQIAGRPAVEDDPIAAAAAWRHGHPLEEPIVALLDDGVERRHPDLVFWFDEENAAHKLFPSEPKNAGDRHGTACAGVLGAIANNNDGIAGIAPGTLLMPLRRGVDDLSIVRAIDFAVEHGADVLVLPWGWTGAPSQTISDTLHDAIDAGTLVVAAAGDADVHPPYADEVDFPCTLGAATDLFCVGAASVNGEPKGAASPDGLYWWRSASSRREPDLLAPGTWLHATDRGGVLGYNDGSGEIRPEYTDDFGGTGAAACYLGGVLSLMASRDPQMTPSQAREILWRTSRELALRPGRDEPYRLVVPDEAVLAAVLLEASRKKHQEAGAPEADEAGDATATEDPPADTVEHQEES